MDYKELIENQDFSSPSKIADWIWNATCAMNDLLSRAEAAEARCKRLDEARERANEACAKWEYKAKKAERERDAAIQYMRKVFGWCTGCAHFTGIYGSGCKIGAMDTCGGTESKYLFLYESQE